MAWRQCIIDITLSRCNTSGLYVFSFFMKKFLSAFVMVLALSLVANTAFAAEILGSKNKLNVLKAAPGYTQDVNSYTVDLQSMSGNFRIFSIAHKLTKTDDYGYPAAHSFIMKKTTKGYALVLEFGDDIHNCSQIKSLKLPEKLFTGKAKNMMCLTSKQKEVKIFNNL